MNWKFWQNKKTLAVTIAAAVVVVAGTAVTVALLQPKPVTQEQAQTIALEHAGVVAADAVSMKVDFFGIFSLVLPSNCVYMQLE